MTVFYILIPVAILLVGIAILIFNWAVNNGQYDDLDGPAHSILFDDDLTNTSQQETAAPDQDQDSPSNKQPDQPL